MLLKFNFRARGRGEGAGLLARRERETYVEKSTFFFFFARKRKTNGFPAVSTYPRQGTSPNLRVLSLLRLAAYLKNVHTFARCCDTDYVKFHFTHLR